MSTFPSLLIASILLALSPGMVMAGKTGSYVYREAPARRLTIYYPQGWQQADLRPALVIFRCNIPEQRKHFLERGMVVIKPATAPVNSGRLPSMRLEEIAKAAKPREQVMDCKSAIRFIRANAKKIGIDPKKIVATGTSGGADLALLTHLNQSFVHPEDDQSVSASPDALVLYSPAFDGLDIWFVKSADFYPRLKAEAPAFAPLLERFVTPLDSGYIQPLDHRAVLLELADELGRERGIPGKQVAAFKDILSLLNKRDWQLLHPVKDALKMSASRILTRDPLPPTIVLLGDRDHLRVPQLAFVKRARELGQRFEQKEYENGGHSFMTMPAFERRSTLAVDAFLVRNGVLTKLEMEKAP